MPEASQLKIYLTALASSFTIDVLIPLVVLLIMFAVAARLLFLAQKRDDFDIANFMKNDANKESSAILISFFAFGVHTWYLMVSLLQKGPNTDLFTTYGVVWSCSIALAKWDGKLPGTGA